MWGNGWVEFLPLPSLPQNDCDITDPDLSAGITGPGPRMNLGAAKTQFWDWGLRVGAHR